ncbi:HD-GYP domain-containing protein [Paucibacter sp. Y2R2-4]|uniref:HD-GYP domain-containing protein n=1 Tax=Paucibacter sp. Y2R2-4 TaxID=2893553 RepID=UPI0021E456AD|nr:HD-GYP domain-containing protein [Paucibacter sp. Y2R2-4]MCV2349192.1 HD-GYP domain-containing protein [Paucibacter sp. Y2R2-4]
MLKKIPTQQVQLGMYIQSLEGSWLSHPFWKTKFLLQEQGDLELLLTSGVAMVWIDCSKGDDVGAVKTAAAPLPFELPVQEMVATSAPAAPAAAPQARLSMGAEVERAAQVVNRSRQAVLSLFGEARMGRAVDTEQCLPIVEEVADSVARNPSALISLARLKTKDNYTYMHSVAVCALMVSLARRLGLDEAQSREAGLAGLLHDIGKMAMPQDVLNKPGQLSESEFNVIRTHPERGFEMLKQGAAVPAAALEVCLHHHEKIDGSGYPHQLQGEQISLLARMGAVCDVYDAITSTRPYKAAWDPAGSIQRMAGWKGHFDPAIFKAFVASVGIYPVGSLVRLESGRLAVVTDLNPLNLAAPVVRVFYSTRSKMPIPVQTLDLSASGAKDRVLGRESPQEWGFPHLEDIWRQA